MAKAKKADAATDETATDEVVGAQPDENSPEPYLLAAAPTADPDAEFPTPWHRDAYIDGLEREIASAKQRLEELAAVDAHPQTLADTQTQLDNATAELARVNKKR